MTCVDEKNKAICREIKREILGSEVKLGPKRRRMSIRALAEEIKESEDVLGNITREITPASEDIIAKLRKALRKSAPWPYVAGRKSEGHRVSLAGTPLYPVKIVGSVAAGEGVTNVDVDEYNSLVFVPEKLAQIGGLGWVVDGESMMPLLGSGDVAIFRESRQPRRKFTYLLHRDGEYKVKIMDWANGEWFLRSLNTAVPAGEIEGWQLLGFLIGWYKTKGSRETLDSDPEGLILEEP